MAVICKCGERMNCVETRKSGEAVRRRYHCQCGMRASTKEIVVDWDKTVRVCEPGMAYRQPANLVLFRRSGAQDDAKGGA